MKTYSLRLIAAIGLAAIAVMPVLPAAQQQPRQLFERARVLEESSQLPEAIKLYQQVVTHAGSDTELAAQAQYHIGLTFEKLGNSDAQKAYEQTIRDYPKQPAAEDARRRLAILSDPRAIAAETDRLICSDCGALSVSTDGRMMAFNGPNGLATEDLATRQITQLIPARVWAAVISPDLKRIAYQAALEGPLSEKRLAVMANEAGAKPRILNTDPAFLLTPAAWARDGQSVLVMAYKDGSAASGGPWFLGWVSTTDGSFTRPLKPLDRRSSTDGGMVPSLSPDGRYIAYAARVPAGGSRDTHIYVSPADFSTEIELVKGVSRNEAPVWTPDGTHLLFVSDRGGSLSLWSVAVTDRSLKQIRPSTGEIRPLVTTPSGSLFYSRSIRPNEGTFAISKLNGAGEPENILGYYPVLSPDGKTIAFERNINGAKTLFTYSLDTKNEKRFTPSAILEYGSKRVRWFGDSKSVLLDATDSAGVQALYRVDVENEDFKRIEAPRHRNSLLSNDGKTAYLIVNGEASVTACRADRIVALDLNSGRRREVAIVSTPVEYFDLVPDSIVISPDDKTLFMTTCDEGYPRRIEAVDIATGQRRTVFAARNPAHIGDIAVAFNGATLVAVLVDLPIVTLRNPQGNAGNARRLIRIGVDGNNYQELYKTSGISFLGSPNPLLNGDWVIAGNGPDIQDTALLRLPANGGAPKVLAPATGWFSVSRDGSLLAGPSTTSQRSGRAEELRKLDNVSSFTKSR